MVVQSFKEYLDEAANVGGLEYEIKCYNACKKAEEELDQFNVIGDKPSGGFNAHDVDLSVSIKGHQIAVEIKKSMEDQMGGTSFRYDMHSKHFTPVKDIPEDDLELLMDVAKGKTQAIDDYIHFMQKQDPIELHSRIKGVPITVSKAARDAATQAGKMRPINAKIRTTANFVEKHYNKKNCFYIQLGGGGLYYMGRNPLNLPVPRLQGDIDIEFRLGYSGTKGKFRMHNGETIETRTANLRIQGRLKFRQKSPYTLDDAASIKKMMEKVK